ATTFTMPAANNTTLKVTDDTDHTCDDGFQYTVQITSAAPDDTVVSLYAGNLLLRTTTVTGGTASFPVVLSTGSTAESLSIQYPSTTACSVTSTVTVDCPNTPPSCTISAPVISATHPALNGIATPAGDRVSSVGSPYQATFKVQTSAEDGQPVTLAVNNVAPGSATTMLNATASAGVATFTVTLVPDATYAAAATCTNRNGISGSSSKGTFLVDTTAPDLTVNSPSAGQFIVAPVVHVCGQTDSPDATALSSSLGASQNNFCVTVGSAATPSCAPVTAVNSPACIDIPCPGAAPFALTIALKDSAGNPTSQTLTGLTCVSALPTVQIISPLSGSPGFTDKTKNILAATAPTGVKDLDANTAGAQVNVVACTDAVGTAVLTVGHVGDATLAQLGSSVPTAAAVAGDNCPAGLPNVVKFPGVTLPQSTEGADGTLVAATRLIVSVTSAANTLATGVSPADDVWIDTVPPAVGLAGPSDFCSFKQSSQATVPQSPEFTADDSLVVLDVTNGAVTTSYDTPVSYMSGVAQFANVILEQGQNTVTVTNSDPAGNSTSVNVCTVTVGMAPVVTFTTPTAGAILCPAGATSTACIPDNNAGTAGWQGSLAVTVTAGSTNTAVTTGDLVTFSIGGNSLGSANLDGSGHAQLNGITIPDGVQTVVATTAAITNSGVGAGSVTVTVDTTPPAAPTGLNAAVLDRRKTTMQLTWTAPSDGVSANVAGYQVRYAKVPIDSTNFDNPAVTTAVAYTGAPSTPGHVDGVTVSGLYIENGYYFAVEAVDVAGNISPILASPASGTCTCAGQCCAAHFNMTTVASGLGLSDEQFGNQLDGTGDVNGDGLSDIIVGTTDGQHAYLYLGTSGTFSPSAPAVTFSGDGTTVLFGYGVAQIGDIDADGREDIAISDPGSLKVFIYKGRSVWPLTMGPADANYVVSTDASYVGSAFATSIARLGDFNGDGVDDFAIGADGYKVGGFSSVGRVIIVLGAAGFGGVALPSATGAITIDGDSSLTKPLFGAQVLGLGHFYSVTTGTTLVVSSPGLSSSANSSQGRLYAFHGQPGTAGAISIATADSVVVGPVNKTDMGSVLSNLGPLVNGLPSVASGNPLDAVSTSGISGSVFLFSGDTTAGVFANRITLSRSGASRNGEVMLGGAVSGRNSTYSLLGDSHADLVLAAQTAANI
ncbi:MAG TPA: FG-GAP-like repeat-containing protein, partial [Acidothermaceae bacterium]